VILGIGLAVAAPVVLPAVAAGVRPIAKTAVRGWLAVAGGMQGFASKTREQMSDLVAEVRSEREDGARAGSTPGGAPTPAAPKTPAKAGAKA
jgi:hypothetical protein